MNKKNVIKALAVIAAINICALKISTKKTGNLIANNKITDTGLVTGAVESIQKILSDEKSEPFRIYKTYKLYDNQPLLVSTKTYYKEYRKKPTYEEQAFKTKDNLDANQIIEFVYNSSDKEHITKKNQEA